MIEYETGHFETADHYFKLAIEAGRKSDSIGARGFLAYYIAMYAYYSGQLRWLDIAESCAREVLSNASAAPTHKLRSGHTTLALLAVIRADAQAAKRQYKVLKSNPLADATHNSERLLGLLMRTLGDFDRAIGHLRISLAQSQKQGSLRFEAWDTFDLAGTLLKRNGQRDRHEALELLVAALDMSRERGMVLLESRTKKLLDDIEASPAGSNKKGYPDGLTAREVEVLSLVQLAGL